MPVEEATHQDGRAASWRAGRETYIVLDDARPDVSRSGSGRGEAGRMGAMRQSKGCAVASGCLAAYKMDDGGCELALGGLPGGWEHRGSRESRVS